MTTNPAGATLDLTQYIPDIELTRLGENEEAGLLIASLPWPRNPLQNMAFDGQDVATQLPLGRWPGTNVPRRLLLMADNEGAAPESLWLANADPELMPAANFSVEAELFERSPYERYVWERHLLRLRHGNNNVGLVMGLRTGSEVHWWEACRLVILERTPTCIVFEMGGAIPHKQMTHEEFTSYKGLTNPFLHKHNWLYGRIYGRLHYNGVCEIFAHHINSKFFDDGLDLEDCVPVIGIDVENDKPEIQESHAWDGSQTGLEIGSVRFDLTEVARLATPAQPGRLDVEGRFLVLQPYLGMELFGGTCPEQLSGDRFILHAEEKKVLRGMGRSLNFSLSLSARSPRVARYLAPAWWYGLCQELTPASLLPVSNKFDEFTAEAAEWVVNNVVSGGFEDGSLPRNLVLAQQEGPGTRCEPGWEGEIPFGALQQAWRTGDAALYTTAVRAGYCFTDVYVDHAAKSVRMHGYPPPGFSVPMNRMQASIGTWLETGDPYLIEAAQAVTVNSHYINKNSWPRMAVGRDACYVRSAVLLYRYLGDDYFGRIAHEGALISVEAQRENGSFGDQGGGAGIHMWAAYITKPWMGTLALNGVLDYLEAIGEDPRLSSAVIKFADWLMAERVEREVQPGWCYQHDYNKGRKFYAPHNESWYDLPGPSKWHHDSVGRLLAFATFRTGDPDYLAAWFSSRPEKSLDSDHAVAAALQFVPWLQDWTWLAVPTEDGIQVQATYFGEGTPDTAVVQAPSGIYELKTLADGRVELTSMAPEVTAVELQGDG